MTRVCVVGGGRAGLSACAEAATNGDEVSLFERGPLSGSEGHVAMLESQGVQIRTEEPVLSVGASYMATPRGSVAFDSVVIATGCRPLRRPFPGHKKAGVILLDHPDSLIEKGMDRPGAHRVVVSGSGLPALRVADRLAVAGRRVTLLTNRPAPQAFLNPEVSSQLRGAAEERGVSILDSELARVLGLEEVEAVLAGGSLIPCDLLVTVPAMVPNVAWFRQSRTRVAPSWWIPS
ncbi:MAG: FAD-dependent oxidoreductase [Candidatus Gagatemarchaeaceae archaeon]